MREIVVTINSRQWKEKPKKEERVRETAMKESRNERKRDIGCRKLFTACKRDMLRMSVFLCAQISVLYSTEHVCVYYGLNCLIFPIISIFLFKTLRKKTIFSHAVKLHKITHIVQNSWKCSSDVLKNCLLIYSWHCWQTTKQTAPSGHSMQISIYFYRIASLLLFAISCIDNASRS